MKNNNKRIITQPTIVELREEYMAKHNGYSLFLLECEKWGYVSSFDRLNQWNKYKDRMREAISITNKFKTLGGEI